MESIQLNYSVPIVENFSENGDFLIKGTAINATTTDNGHTFLVEELRPSASSLNGVPLLVDHNNLVENIKGRVLAGTFNEELEKVDFKAVVMDKGVQEMIKDGRLNSVSVGANVQEITEGDDGNLIARGIKFKELSLVAVPADDGATFGIAMAEAYKIASQDNPESEEEEDLEVLKGGSENSMENNNDAVLEAIASIGKDFQEKLEAIEVSMEEKFKAMEESDADEESEEEESVEEESKEESEEEKEVEESDEEEEEEEEEKTEESSKYQIKEGHGSLRGNSFSYDW